MTKSLFPITTLTYICFVLTSILFFNHNSLAQEGEIPTDQAIIDAGQTLFRQNCSPCHRVKEKLIGPALEGIYDRRDLSWIVSFVKNSQKVISGGDDYAVNLYDEYNKVEMPAFDFFSDEEIVSIFAYIKFEAEAAPVEEIQTTGIDQVTTSEPSIPTSYLNAILIGLLIVLALILVVLGVIITVLKKYLSQRDLTEAEKEIVTPSFSLERILKHKVTLGVLMFVFMAILLKNVIDGLYNIGVQQGYAPTQPIAFSHKIHAGQFQIDCNYCHTGVTKSKNANIPSTNICMNCHTEILKDSPEIKKIYAAIEKDRPIEWVRVHNLPDLSYFNHAQHVKVGGVECQTCHGPIEEMDVVRQYAKLTMGWCIDCHQKTDLNTKGNEYYTKLVELHDENNKEPMKVEDIGGLECAKCHY